MIKHSIVWLILIGIGFLSVAVGCGPKGRTLRVEYVEGVVTLDGQPVAGAMISFIPKNEGGKEETASGYSDERGVYKLTSMNGNPERGAVEGEYIVTVSKIEIVSPSTEGMSYEEVAASPERFQSTQTQLLPVIYQNRNNTPLSATVNRGRNKIDLELLSNP